MKIINCVHPKEYLKFLGVGYIEGCFIVKCEKCSTVLKEDKLK